MEQYIKKENMCKIEHQTLHIRKQAIRKFMRRNWYALDVDIMAIERIK